METSREPAGGTVTLASGAALPLLGFGTWQIPEEQAPAAVAHALQVGYRHLDTATRYRNEAGVGRGLAESGVARDDVFVTTKLPPDRTAEARPLLEQSLTSLGIDRLDLWLIHAPGGEDRDDPLVEAWEEMIGYRDEGLVAALGVSNYTVEQLDVLTERTGVTPVLNQIVWSPSLWDPAVVAGHAERGVVLEGYSPLRKTNLEDPTLVEIARAHDATAAQVVIAWHLARGYVVLPKSSNADRITENFAATRLTLTPDELTQVDGVE
ncbi:aldo/keto reductase [Microlunatus sp. Y2014]|uniref:aldo/keto reductase n=1 Tax=Microlunatus sp. Y2014 TaxID=3418488 RepID=UPI003DA79C3B